MNTNHKDSLQERLIPIANSVHKDSAFTFTTAGMDDWYRLSFVFHAPESVMDAPPMTESVVLAHLSTNTIIEASGIEQAKTLFDGMARQALKSAPPERDILIHEMALNLSAILYRKDNLLRVKPELMDIPTEIDELSSVVETEQGWALTTFFEQQKSFTTPPEVVEVSLEWAAGNMVLKYGRTMKTKNFIKNGYKFE